MVLMVSTSQLADVKPESKFLSPHTGSTLSLSSLSSSLSSSSTLSDVSPLPSPTLPPKPSKTNAFFSSPWSTLPVPSSPAKRPSGRSSSESTSATTSDSSDKDSGRTSSLDSTPVTSPSLQSTSSTDDSPPSKPRLAPLSRLFPSRFNAAPRQTWDTPKREYLDPDQTPKDGSVFNISVDLCASPIAVAPPSTLLLPSVGRRIVSAPSARVRTPSPLRPSPSPAPMPPVREATVVPTEAVAVSEGTVIGAEEDLPLSLVRVLGQGAFSSVWLARQLSHAHVDAWTKPARREIDGTYPSRDGHVHSHGGSRPASRAASECSVYLDERDGEGASGSLFSGADDRREGRLVAVKMTDRKLCEINDRTRVSFVREVEVLRHISHRSIAAYLGSFTTPTHHCLVLEYVGGGEIFDFINSDEHHARLDEPLLRRMWGELCKAVGWMHGVCLVHRDIKLENILLTANPFTSSALPPPTIPLVKLTDFGLARFIDAESPLLTTRCGSESYAAPELVTGQSYDGRATDAWACGVVLYALATRRLPFDEAPPAPGDEVRGRRAPANGSAQQKARRRLLVRIANAEYDWPGLTEDEAAADSPVAPYAEFGADADDTGVPPLAGTALVRSAGVRRIVRRLLVREPAKRARIVDLWDDAWMIGDGAPVAPAAAERNGSLSRRGSRRKGAGAPLSRNGSLLSRNGSGLSRTGSLLSHSDGGLSRRGSRRNDPEVMASLNASVLALAADGELEVPEGTGLVVDGGLVESPMRGDFPEDVESGYGDLDDEVEDVVEVEEHGALLDEESIDDIARQELR